MLKTLTVLVKYENIIYTLIYTDTVAHTSSHLAELVLFRRVTLNDDAAAAAAAAAVVAVVAMAVAVAVVVKRRRRGDLAR